MLCDSTSDLHSYQTCFCYMKKSLKINSIDSLAVIDDHNRLKSKGRCDERVAGLIPPVFTQFVPAVH